MSEFLDSFSRVIGSSSRRGILRMSTAAGLGVLWHAGIEPERLSARGKKKKKQCPKIDEGPICPVTCGAIFHEAGGGTLCGTGLNSPQNPCLPCASSQECTSGEFPNCITDFTIISSGERRQIGVCQPYTNGLCSAVFACRT